MVEQRYQAVREVLDGASIKDVAISYGVNRQTVHRWLVRYASGGLGALADRSCKPGPVSASDLRGDRGADRVASSSASGLGSAHDAEPAAPGARGAAVSVGDLSLFDVPPIRRFELARPSMLDVVDGEIEAAVELEPKKFVTRRVDDQGRILILNNRYHVGRYLTGQSVTVTVEAGLLNVAHNGVVVATHARRHKQEDDERMDRRSRATKPARPTRGNEVFRRVDPKFGALSFAGTSYQVGNRYCGMLAGVRLVGSSLVGIKGTTEEG